MIAKELKNGTTFEDQVEVMIKNGRESFNKFVEFESQQSEEGNHFWTERLDSNFEFLQNLFVHGY
ncbi:MAG: hypothetical protein ACTSU7_06965, partial [Candidatus Heimdallarchaeaceae archaeon]